MDINIGTGEWMNSLMSRMTSAMDGDCFYLPTLMHLHAYSILKEDFFPDRTFKVEIKNSVDAWQINPLSQAKFVSISSL